LPETAIDHLVIVAPSLDAGTRYVEAQLGLAPGGGGNHGRMGTHNRLLRLGPSVYLEVIAVDPEAPAPARPRWFGLDVTPPAPRLATWVARTSKIEESAAACGEDLGAVEPMTRGPFSWRITIARGGALPFDGVMPALIQWDGDMHPAQVLPDSGCSLVQLEGAHPEAPRVRRALDAIAFDGAFSLAAAVPGERGRLQAVIDTPQGRRVI